MNSRYRRRGNRRYRSSGFKRRGNGLVRRAKGNARAAANQTDTTDVVINVITKIKTGVTGYLNNELNIHSMIGTGAINIFELLRKSDFFNCYAPMYDQFRLTSVKVKVTPVSWKTYDQFNLPNASNVYTVKRSKTGETEGLEVSGGTSAMPLMPDQLTYEDDSAIKTAAGGNQDPKPAVGTPAFNITSGTSEYLYPQALTVVTAWDRTGLDSVQLKRYPGNKMDENAPVKDSIVTIGDTISTYSSAKSTQLVAGSTFNCTRYLYPSSQQEKSLYLSTQELKLQQTYHNGENDWWYITDANDVENHSSYITNLGSDPACPFKPIFLIGVMSVDDLDYSNIHNGVVEPTAVKNKIPPVTFNLEFDIGVTFRGLRKSQIV